MKRNRIIVILLALVLLLSFLPALAADGFVDVVMDGDTYHLTLTSVGIVDGQLTVTVEGFGDTLRMGSKGWMVAAWPVAHYGAEAVRAGNVNAVVGGPFDFTFDRDTLPDEIWMDPYDDAEPEALIWQADDAAVGTDDTGAAGVAIPDELVGEWRGTGTPDNGGTPIDLTVTVNPDGSGEYTFAQGGYTESYPFTVDYAGSRFSVSIPADNLLGISACDGTWTLKDGRLLLDIATTFENGRVFAYSAECERVKAEEAASEVTSGIPGVPSIAAPIPTPFVPPAINPPPVINVPPVINPPPVVNVPPVINPPVVVPPPVNPFG